MKVEKLKEFFNTYFKEIGEKNIEDIYFLDEPLEVRLVDVKYNKKHKHYNFFFDTEPERLSHTIEYDDGSPANLTDVVFDECYDAFKLLGIDPFDDKNISRIRLYINKRFIGDQEETDEFPFLDENVSKKVKIRIFSENVKTEELKWHFDEQDRVVIPQHKNNWYFQMDNELPIKLTEGKEYFIPKGVYHRLIKGDGDLKVKIHLK